MIACEEQSIRLRDGDQDLNLKVRVASPERGKLFADVELYWAHGEKHQRLVEVDPSVLLLEDQRVSLELEYPSGKLTLALEGGGFPVTPEAWCLPDTFRSR